MNAKIRLIAVVIAIIVLGVVGVLWVTQNKQPRGPVEAPQTIVDTVDRGISAEDQVKFAEKIGELQAQISADVAEGKRDISVILQLGNMYYTIGELKLASEQYLNILATNPSDAPALENLGQTQKERGDYRGAEQSWRAAVQIEPLELTYFRLADLITEQYPGRQAEIQPLLEDAIATIGQTPGLLVRLAKWYADNGDYEEAVSHYQVALQLNPDLPEVETEIARLRKLMTK